MKYIKKQIIVTAIAVFMGSISFAQATATDFIAGLNSPQELLVVNDTLYIADTGLFRVLEIDLTANMPIATIKIGGILTGVVGFASKDNDLYTTESSTRVTKINLTDASPTFVPVVTGGLQFPYGLQFKENDLYISETTGGKISKIDITTTPSTAMDFVTGLTSPRGLLLNENYLYVAQGGTVDKISKINLTTKVVEDVLTGLNNPNSMVLKGNDLYFSENVPSGKVSKIDISSETTPTKIEVLTGLDSPRGLAIHNNILYIAEAGGTNKISTLALIRSGSLTLSTQTDIDNFASTPFAGIEDDLTINDTTDGNITSLSGLSNIVSVGGNLQILSNTALTSVEGLGNLETLGGQLQIGTTDGSTMNPNTALIDFCAISQLVTGTPPQVIIGEYFVANNGYNPSYVGLASTDAATTASEMDGCRKFGTVVVSTNTFSKEEDYRLFPNPVKDVLFVKSESKITSITISNVSGQEVLKSNSASINVGGLSKGIYFARIVSGEKTIVEKFVKL